MSHFCSEYIRKSRNEFNGFTGGLFAGLFSLCRPQFPIGALFMEVLSLMAVDYLANIGTWFTNDSIALLGSTSIYILLFFFFFDKIYFIVLVIKESDDKYKAKTNK